MIVNMLLTSISRAAFRVYGSRLSPTLYFYLTVLEERRTMTQLLIGSCISSCICLHHVDWLAKGF